MNLTGHMVAKRYLYALMGHLAFRITSVIATAQRNREMSLKTFRLCIAPEGAWRGTVNRMVELRGVGWTLISLEWIFHTCWWSLDTLSNVWYPIFHVWLSTTERRSVNYTSNLIKILVLAQNLEVSLQSCFSLHWGNIPALMRFWTVVNTSFFQFYSFKHEILDIIR